jgi:hypothetical protein
LVSTAFTVETITAATILNFMAFATGATTAYRVARAVKLKYIELWEPYQGVGQITSVAGVEMYGTGATNTGTNDERFASSATPDAPGHLLVRPPKGTLIGYWQNEASTLTYCDIKNCEVGTVIDFAFLWSGRDNDTSTSAVTVSVSGLSAGMMGITRPSTKWSAVGYNNF